MHFLNRSDVSRWFEGQRVAIVGSGPSVLTNAPGHIDGHDVVLRVNNYRTSPAAGFRCDVHYSFYGTSIKVSAATLKRDGVSLCMCKCPDVDGVIDSEWHRRRGMEHGTGWRWVYRSRAAWWPCDVFVPSVDDFMRGFNLLGGHVPTTGFAAILEVLSFHPREVFLTGFDFFRSKMHNVNEPWRPKHQDDPIGHVPERERDWLRSNMERYPLRLDVELERLLGAKAA